MSLTAAELDHALKIALHAAHSAATLIDECIERRADFPIEVESKTSSADLVTQYDKKCEQIVLKILMEGTPSYAIVSEETRNNIPITDAPTWIVDPVDGTTGFVHGSFDCGVSVGLVVNRKPVLGVVNLPRLKEVFHAVEGRGAFCNGKRIYASGCKDITRAIVSTHTSYKRTPAAVNSVMEINKELALMRVHALRSYGAAAMDLCSVACGRVDLYFEVGIQAWDMAAGVIIVREAGGIVHDLDNAGTLDISSQAMICASSHELAKIAMDLSKKHDYRNCILNSKL